MVIMQLKELPRLRENNKYINDILSYMSGLKRNSTELRNSLEYFSDIPFSFLSEENKVNLVKIINDVFSDIFSSLEEEDLEDTVFGEQIKGLCDSTKDIFNEEKFSFNLRSFLNSISLSDDTRSYLDVKIVAEKYLNRVEPFYLSEIQAMKYRGSHKKEEILTHDTEIISKTFQLYALDYFLFAYKNFTSSQNKKSLILNNIEKAPALAVDALDDDMLKKVVYSLYGSEIRERMINDYYKYKKVFLPVCDDASLSDQKIIETQEALRNYCLSLLDISTQYGITIFKNSLLMPYGPNANLLEIKKEISNV